MTKPDDADHRLPNASGTVSSIQAGDLLVARPSAVRQHDISIAP